MSALTQAYNCLYWLYVCLYTNKVQLTLPLTNKRFFPQFEISTHAVDAVTFAPKSAISIQILVCIGSCYLATGLQLSKLVLVFNAQFFHDTVFDIEHSLCIELVDNF